ncbi:zinc finger MYM-type protein 1-like [Xyrichtys novacula]|uniref:Zinc finger MYM-type protein 1-like n=1 Tax=Xyrichtys novacula TaxID=13765 RepID=A0AAV1FYU6_XYRNO|nr:zinc finger MYM-type protein 1-like [Xyrichtys novacula]
MSGSGGKKRESGYARRKKNEEKEKREAKLRESMPRLTTYFTTKTLLAMATASVPPGAVDSSPSSPSSPSSESDAEANIRRGQRNEGLAHDGVIDSTEGPPSTSACVAAVTEPPERDNGSDIDVEEPAAGTADNGAIYSKDPGCWPAVVDEEARHYWIKTGPVACQNRDSDFKKSERVYKHQKRRFSKRFFNRNLVNGEIVPQGQVEERFLEFLPITSHDVEQGIEQPPAQPEAGTRVLLRIQVDPQDQDSSVQASIAYDLEQTINTK